MSFTLDAQVTGAILRQVIGHIRDGNLCRARGFGFSDQELRYLSRLTVTDLETLATHPMIVCHLSVDHDLLEAVVQRLTGDVDMEQTINRCLMLGASTQMMYAFFGLTGNDCSTRRFLLGLESRPGRMAMPDEKTEIKAWHYWQRLCDTPNNPQAELDIQGMMALAEETGIALGVIWQLVKTWNRTLRRAPSSAQVTARIPEPGLNRMGLCIR